jgi:hypothetical protein
MDSRRETFSGGTPDTGCIGAAFEPSAKAQGLGTSGRSLFSVGALVACSCCSTGCGILASHFSFVGPESQKGTQSMVRTAGRQAVHVAVERPIASSTKAPQLMSAKAQRVLPAPEFDLTPEVQRELERFLTKDRATVVQVLERREWHSDMLEKVFEGEGVPVELLSVAAIESKFDPLARSPAGARGMWQFMGPTARLYGLKVSGKVDERTDPMRSTIAAAKHLRDLFLSYNDWHLALAAYNAGIGTINKLVNRHGSLDFWHLSREGNMSGETARFVPKVIALAMIVKDPNSYGFDTSAALG